jgi:hypothetical protein
VRRKTLELGIDATAAQSVGGVHQVNCGEYTGMAGLTGDMSPAMIPVLSALSSSPMARVSGEISFTSVMAESGRIELHRVSARLTAYKAASTPNGLRFPYQRPMRFEGIGKNWRRGSDSNR